MRKWRTVELKIERLDRIRAKKQKVPSNFLGLLGNCLWLGDGQKTAAQPAAC